MKILIDYKADQTKRDLTSEIAIDIETDAEALGYFACVSASVFRLMETLIKTADSKYADRIARGITKAAIEAHQEQSDIWPFQSFRVDTKPE